MMLGHGHLCVVVEPCTVHVLATGLKKRAALKKKKGMLIGSFQDST